MKNTLKIPAMVGLITLFAACGAKINKEKTIGAFPVTSPVIIDTVYNSDYVAEIHSRQNIEIRARIKGYMEKIHVDEGEKVIAGQLLFTISSQEYREELLKAQAMLKSAIADAKAAELDLQNVKTLSDKNIVSKTEFEMARSKFDALNAKTEEMRSYEASARLHLAYTEIKAPFEGVIDRIPNKTGSLIDGGTLLTTLSDNKEVYAYFNVSEKEYLAYTADKTNKEESNKVSLILADNSMHAYKGIIETIEGEFNQGTGSIAFRARFPNPEQVLRHGSSGKVRLKRYVKNALVIPQKATFEIQDKMYVFVVDKNNRVKMRNIVSKMRIPHLYIISSGLALSDRIIYEGIQDVTDGLKINPQPVDLKSIIPKLANQ
jgi:RND family efflux transporter MFP subunit